MNFNLTQPSAPTSVEVGPTQRFNPVLLVLGLLLLSGLYALPFVKVAPNRLLSGEPVYLFSMLTGVALLAVLPLVGLLVSAGLKPGKLASRLAAVMAMVLIPGFLALAAGHATQVAAGESPFARTALGSGFWLAVVSAGLVIADALNRLQAGSALRLVALLSVGLPLLALLASGLADSLSIMKEFANRSDVFWLAVGRHLQIVALSMAFALAAGLPLGWGAYRWKRLGASLFPVLNIIQTIPSIALFGLLMAPLAWLASRWPTLAQAGISGVGLAPGVIALMLYSLLPVVRTTLTGLSSVPTAVMQAASGLGLSRWQRFWQVQIPLAWPVVLGGVRTATIQAVGLAAVAALIGAGGLGAIMFEGLFSSAQDLVLLGVVPIVLMGALADGCFRLLARLTAHKGLHA